MSDEINLFQHGMDKARENVAEVSDPEDDIMPVFMWHGHYGTGLMPMLGMKDGPSKDALAAGMMAGIVCGRATQAVMITTSWLVKADRTGEEDSPVRWDGVMPSEHPDRQEVVTVMHVDLKGGRIASAPVIRYPDRGPGLGAWEITDAEGLKVGGRFGEAMDHGLRMANEAPPEMLEIIDLAWQTGEQEELIMRFLKVYAELTGVRAGLRQMAAEGPKTTARAMSEQWHIPLRTIYEVCKSGVLPAVREKGRWLIDVADAAEYAVGYRLRKNEGRER